MVHAALLLLMLEAANARPRFTISLKRSTQNLQLSTSRRPIIPSLHRIATEMLRGRERREGPCVDGSELARTFFTSAVLVGAAMCSASISAVHVTAGHNALRGSGPGQKDAFDNA